MSTLMIPLLKEILMKEIGESNIPPLPFTRAFKNKYKALVDIGDFTETITVEFEDFHDEFVQDSERQYYLPDFSATCWSTATCPTPSSATSS